MARRTPQFVRCPVCGRKAGTFRDHGRLTFVMHGPDYMSGDSCEASGWIVEDEDVAATHAGRVPAG